MGFKGELEDGTASLKQSLRNMQNKDPEQPMAVRRMSQAEISHGKGEWTRLNQKRGGEDRRMAVGQAEWLNKTVKHDMG